MDGVPFSGEGYKGAAQPRPKPRYLFTKMSAVFADCGTETIEVLIARNRYGRQVTESLIEYINMRVEMEKSITKGFEKLAAFEFPALYPIMKKALKKSKAGGVRVDAAKEVDQRHLGAALVGIQKDLVEQARKHKEFAKSLEKNVLAEFRKSFSKQVGTKMKYKTKLLDAAEDITKSEKRIKEMTSNISKFKNRAEECRAKRANSPDDLRLEAEISRAENNFDQARRNLEDAETALIRKKEKFSADLSQAAEEIANEDVARIRLTVRTMGDFAKIIQTHDADSSDFATRMEDMFNYVDADQETSDFVVKYVVPFMKMVETRPVKSRNKYVESEGYEQEERKPARIGDRERLAITRGNSGRFSGSDWDYESSH